LDASTDYTKYPFCKDVVERLKASSPRKFKLIYIMRHPLRRIESHARYVERTRMEVGRSPSPRMTHSLDAGISPVSFAISRYAYQIDIFEDYYEQGNLLLLTLEQLARRPDIFFRNVCEFLEIKPMHPREISLRSNAATSDTLARRLRDSFYPTWQKLRGVSALRRAAKVAI